MDASDFFGLMILIAIWSISLLSKKKKKGSGFKGLSKAIKTLKEEAKRAYVKPTTAPKPHIGAALRAAQRARQHEAKQRKTKIQKTQQAEEKIQPHPAQEVLITEPVAEESAFAELISENSILSAIVLKEVLDRPLAERD